MQVNITLPDDWKTVLDKIARKEAFEQDRDYSYLDVIRDAIKKQCGILSDELMAKYALNNIEYIENNIKIQHSNNGLVNFKLYDFQKRYLKFLDDNRFVILPKFRHSGFMTTTLAWVLWDSLHHQGRKTITLSNTQSECNALRNMVETMIITLPLEVRPTIKNKNSGKIEFDNKSQILFSSCGHCKNSIFPNDLDHMVIDNAAFIDTIENHFKAIFAYNSEIKCTIVSTQNDLGWFFQTLNDAERRRNNFKIFKCNYLEHPAYQNKTFIKDLRAEMSEKAWRQEIECCVIVDE